MTHFSCPLCGRLVSMTHFDPSSFEHDIYGVVVSGLGRGRGFQVVDRYSLLDDPYVMGLISDRCHRILNMINSRGYIPPGEVDALRATLEESFVRIRRQQKTIEEQRAQLANMETEMNKLKWTISDLETQLEDFDDVQELEGEMEMLLNWVNKSTNADFECLYDAIGFLLEG